MNIELVRTLVAYDRALYARVWDSIMRLTPDQFLHDVPYSHGSLRHQMVHVAVVYVRWLRALQGVPNARAYTLNPADYPTREATRALWEMTSKDLYDYVLGLEEAALGRIVPAAGGPMWQVLEHLALHGADHRAQMLRILHDFGAPTFDQDLILYLWPR